MPQNGPIATSRQDAIGRLVQKLFGQESNCSTVCGLLKLLRMSKSQSRLSKDIEITGTMKFQGELVFEGKFHGELVQGSALFIGEGAEVHSKAIIVDNLTSAGLVDGEAQVAQRCHLQETAHLQGSLKTFRLAMEDGATFAGALEISKPANITAGKKTPEQPQ